MFCVFKKLCHRVTFVTNFGIHTAETRQAELVPLVLILVELSILRSKNKLPDGGWHVDCCCL